MLINLPQSQEACLPRNLLGSVPRPNLEQTPSPPHYAMAFPQLQQHYFLAAFLAFLDSSGASTTGTSAGASEGIGGAGANA